MNRKILPKLLVLAFAACISFEFSLPESVRAQNARESDPSSALSAALVAACRANEAQFANYLTDENKNAFLRLPDEQRRSFLKRLSLTNDPGQPLISSDDHKRIVLHCQAAAQSAEFHLGDPRVHENLAFIPITAADGNASEFGLVKEGGGWRLLSLGLVLLDIPQLSKEWAGQEVAAREEAAIETIRGLADAVQSYRRAFGKLPESLAQLGPAPQDEISPDQANLVNEHLAGGGQGGYQFRYRIVPAADDANSGFELAATPDAYPKNGRRSFFLDAQGKVHGADKHGGVATPDDPLIPGEKAA
jgi:hypothetical protein